MLRLQYKSKKNKVLKRILLLFFLVIGLAASAQRQKVLNYQIVDDKKVHFGFSLGLNWMDMNIDRNAYTLQQTAQDTIPYPDVSSLEPGFNVNIISELRLSEDFTLRFLPGLVFGQRSINFFDGGEEPVSNQLESNYLDFPLHVKYRAKRLNNYRPYLLAGTSVRYDMAAKKEFDEDSKDLIRLKKFDYFFEAGFGIDYYLPYFKFSTEIKLSLGMRDVLVHEGAPGNTRYASAMDRITSKLVIINFHFE